MNRQISNSPRVGLRSLQRKIAVNVSELRKFAESAVQACLRLAKKNASNLAGLDEVSIIIISDRRMAELHQRFMNQAGPTDVLTFQHGEIFISADTANANAKRFGTSLRRELRLYIIHGLLHLQGFDDRDAKSARRMRTAERKVLNELLGPARSGV
jgi:probable rRNA maturation factor